MGSVSGAATGCLKLDRYGTRKRRARPDDRSRAMYVGIQLSADYRALPVRGCFQDGLAFAERVQRNPVKNEKRRERIINKGLTVFSRFGRH